MEQIFINQIDMDTLIDSKVVSPRTAKQLVSLREEIGVLTEEAVKDNCRLSQDILDRFDYSVDETKEHKPNLADLAAYKQTQKERDTIRRFEKSNSNRESSDDEGTVRRGRKKGTSKPILPKLLVYDGKGKWETFLRKFKMFLRQNNVTYIGDKLYYLSLALEGKVGDYLMRLTKNRDFTEISDVYDLLGKRFGERELSQAALLRFEVANQKANEDIDDWADRVWDLAYQAYPDELSHDALERQVILRFSLGLFEKGAAQYIAAQEISTMSAALRRYRMYMYSRNAVDGRSCRDSSNRGREDHRVRVISRDSSLVRDRSPSPKSSSSPKFFTNQNSDPRWNKMNEIMLQLCQKMDQMIQGQDQMIQGQDQMLQLLKKRSASPAYTGRPPRSLSNSPSRNVCFFCKEQGHFKSACPKLKKNVSFQDPNSQGSD